MSLFSIRKLKPKESHLYREIRLECLKLYPNNFSSIYEVEKSKSHLFFQPHIEDSNNNQFVIGAFQYKQLIGISGFNRYNEEKLNQGGRIVQVYVTPKFQGQNIGQQMVTATLKAAFETTEIDHIDIGVMATNQIAKSIYETIGFKLVGTEKIYKKNSSSCAVDNLIMSMTRHIYEEFNY